MYLPFFPFRQLYNSIILELFIILSKKIKIMLYMLFAVCQEFNIFHKENSVKIAINNDLKVQYWVKMMEERKAVPIF